MNMKFMPAFLVLVLGGCGFEGVTGSGNLVTKDLTVSEFQKIDAGGSFSLDVTQGDKPSVTVTADDNVWEMLTIESRDGTLHLATKPGSYNNVHLEAKIVTPQLSGLDLSGASKAKLHGIDRKNETLSIEGSGASSVDGDVHAGELTVGLSGASKAVLVGSADAVHVEASGASHASLEKLSVNSAKANASGASSIQVNTKTLDYDLSERVTSVVRWIDDDWKGAHIGRFGGRDPVRPV